MIKEETTGVMTVAMIDRMTAMIDVMMTVEVKARVTGIPGNTTKVID